MPAIGDTVTHRTAGTTGTVTDGPATALNPYDQAGPWWRVEWPDGLECWSPETELTIAEPPGPRLTFTFGDGCVRDGWQIDVATTDGVTVDVVFHAWEQNGDDWVLIGHRIDGPEEQLTQVEIPYSTITAIHIH